MPPYGMLPNPLLRGLHVNGGGQISRQSLYDLTYSSVTVARARTTRSSPTKKRPAVQATATVTMEKLLSSEGAEATSQNRV